MGGKVNLDAWLVCEEIVFLGEIGKYKVLLSMQFWAQYSSISDGWGENK